jgi:deoxycytidine triphosphate deaminase
MEDVFRAVKNDDEAEAIERSRLFRCRDPFPSVPRALLSSVEIQEYNRVTAMLHPFYPDNLKSASYQAYLGGRYIFWDKENKCHDNYVKRGDFCNLPANTIGFFEIEPTFRLPNYIALRFNLRITHVHRGLLLGTGPLVDPGFQGRLLIPVHNLTDSDYDMDTNEALIWIEFTKTTYGLAWPEGIRSKEGKFYGFPKHNLNLKPENYLTKANKGNPIRSSISGFVARTTKLTDEARMTADDAKRSSRRIEFGGFAILLVTAVGILWGGYSLLMSANTLVASVSVYIGSLKEESQKLKKKVSDIQEDLRRQQKYMSELHSRLRKMESDVDKENR